MNLQKIIERGTNDKIMLLGEGTSAIGYQSISNPNLVYLAAHNDDLVRPLYASIDRTKYLHIPRFKPLFETNCIEYTNASNITTNKQYIIWQTDYNPKAIENTLAAEQNAILEHVWSNFDRKYFYNATNPIKKTESHKIVELFINYLKNHNLVANSIIESLTMIYTLALKHSPVFKFEFQCYNLGIDTTTDELILRDSIVFFEHSAYARWTFGIFN